MLILYSAEQRGNFKKNLSQEEIKSRQAEKANKSKPNVEETGSKLPGTRINYSESHG